MTKATMPEPAAWAHDHPDRIDVIHAEVKDLLRRSDNAAAHLHRPLDKSARYTIPLITTAQAEAYADARVREALEEAARICWEMQSNPEFGRDYKDHWLAIAERRILALVPPTELLKEVMQFAREL